MKPATAITILACTFLGSFTYSQYHLAQRLTESRDRVEASAQQGAQWMEDTTARLDQIHAGIESLTGDTLELAARIDDLNDRITHLETVQ